MKVQKQKNGLRFHVRDGGVYRVKPKTGEQSEKVTARDLPKGFSLEIDYPEDRGTICLKIFRYDKEIGGKVSAGRWAVGNGDTDKYFVVTDGKFVPEISAKQAKQAKRASRESPESLRLAV